MPTYKTFNKKYGKLPAKLAEETPWNKICVDIIGPYKICRKGRYNLIKKYVTMIDPVTGWFEITPYNDKNEMPIVNLVEITWLVRYPWPEEIMYDRGGKFLGNDLKNILIEKEYGIQMKCDSSGNPQANATIKRINQVLGNLVRSYNLQETYLDEADPWMGILVAAAVVAKSTYHRTKQKIPGQLVLGRDMILTIDNIANWRYIRQRK